MEEDLNENELEERFYSMLHYVDESQANVATNHKDVNHIVDNIPQSTVRRYWRTSGDQALQKVNAAKDSNLSINKSSVSENAKTKEEKHQPTPPLSADLSIFQSPVPQYIKKSIEILENDEPSHVVELETSDEDEVIEVQLPPKPTITIDSSDEDEISEISKINELKDKNSNRAPENKISTNRGDREVSASPVPSIVSSVSDEFIRGDCIALNISSKRPNNHSFDFSLHGSDIMDESTPPKKKKKKKNKEAATSTPVTSTQASVATVPKEGEYFATPKSKARKKKQKKNYSVSEKSIPNADVYDSDSNQSTIDLDKNHGSYSVTEKSFPSTDVYESDSNQSEKTSPAKQNQKGMESDICTTSDSSICLEKHDSIEQLPKAPKQNSTLTQQQDLPTVDLTDTTLDQTVINENIVMANVTGFPEPEESGVIDITPEGDATRFGSTKVPAILYEDLDFDNLKGKDKVCKKRRYSLTTLRAEMEKFYNESWGGENFNHREIQKNMSRDKSLWVIDPKDRMPGLSRRKPTCNYCNRPGHRDDMCRMKPPVCYMCGSTGHYEPRCPRKICVNCGSPNHMYTTMCRNCSNWNNIRCAECGQIGHPSSHCPDLWRRYHNTITCNTPLEENRQTKKHYQMFCSGCARRGHLVHTCRLSLPFSGLPINSPYVSLYHPIYFSTNENTNPFDNNTPQRNRQFNRYNTQDSTISSATIQHRNDRNKRQSNSPICHESHVNKKRNTSNSEETDLRRNTKSPKNHGSERKTSQNFDHNEDTNKIAKETNKLLNNNSEPHKTTNTEIEKASDFIPLSSTNHDKKGQIIQDNEVSDTSDIVTSARIYITNDIIEKLKTKDGEEWLKKSTQKNNVTLQTTDFNLFIGILGKVADQEAFQAELRDWIKSKENTGNVKSGNDLEITKEMTNEEAVLCNNIPRNRCNVLRKINKALELLKEDLGDPKDIYKELTYLQNHHQQLLKQKEVSPKQLSNNRDNINDMLKKLNMVLIGQAGLADGSKHLSELYSLQEKLTNFRQKYIPPQMREEIGQHYHCIFTAIPRKDYQELLNKYYVTKSKPVLLRKKKNDKSIRLSPAVHAKKKFAKNWHKKRNDAGLNGSNEIIEDNNAVARNPFVEQTINRLVFYHRRLMRAKPHDNVLNKTRVELVNKLNSHISSLGQKNNMSPNAMRKMRKKMKITQEQAQLFLTNV
ncbi:unnamed protein product [Parnassius apollo]|uniref:Zinc finger CCHC domain-containing protein 7 n=1 Tax=Parnassius apollo TaxID=110799 RepID=A0A8S3WRN4_PARAO|nr:unnamed protein product [Parnassius apollo]